MNDPHSILENQIGRALALLDLERHGEALVLLQSAAAHSPESHPVHCLLSQTLLLLGRPVQAEQHACEAITIDAENEWGHRLHALALHHQKRGREAAAAIREALRLAPDLPATLATHAQILGYLGYEEEAFLSATRLIELAPDSAFPYGVRAMVSMQAGLHAPALKDLRRAIALDPDNPEYHNNLGVILQHGGQAGAAINAFATAVRLDPSSPVTVANATSLASRHRDRTGCIYALAAVPLLYALLLFTTTLHDMNPLEVIVMLLLLIGTAGVVAHCIRSLYRHQQQRRGEIPADLARAVKERKSIWRRHL